MTLVKITGNTYPVREALKGLGGQWNPTDKAWMVPEDKAEMAKKIVAGASTTTNTVNRPANRSAETKRCWECGCLFTYADAKANDGDWRESYCGC